MHTSYVSIMHCEKTSVTDMFRQRAVIEFLVKGGKLKSWFNYFNPETKCQSMGWHHTTSPQKEAGNSTLGRQSYGKVRDAKCSTFWKKGKRSI
jgi:hypothetical protein